MKKLERKKMKSPDLLQEQFIAFVDWCMKQKQQLILAGVGLLVLVLAGAGWSYYINHQRTQRQIQLSAIDAIVDKEDRNLRVKQRQISVKMQDAYFKVSKLDRQIKELGNTPAKANKKAKTKQAADKKSKAQLEKELADAKSELERLQKDVFALKPDHKKSGEQYRTFAQQFAGTAEGRRASLAHAQILLEQEEFGKAEAVLKGILADQTSFDFYQVQVRALYVGVLEELKRFDEAAKEAEILVARSQEETKPKHLMIHARVLMAAGKVAEGQKLLDEVLSKYAQSAEVHQARAMRAAWVK